MKTISAISKKAPRTVKISTGYVELEGELELPDYAPGVVLFAHGSGSSRHSPRNQYVAEIIREAGLGTLLFDLLTHEEEQQDAITGALRFDIDLLAQRLIGVTRWLERQPETRGLKAGYFGASTGGAAALMAAAELGDRVAAVVSRGGRPDLAGNALHKVRSPTLLIVGGYDEMVICLNNEAYDKLRCEKDFRIVPCATHLFEEPGKLEQVAQISAHWFSKHMGIAAEWEEAA
ncbi:dienelactone hydrolase family protein [Prosthecobacter sp.]|uniref:dienelactone hydrolase family protein n=1 Tax=Prosthecobacter sp. TaxID=1965333 RepID=UPI002ABAE47B|nr:dienelactone hydrolase family protein [Prosthecobacter sp.]MDZ4403622.1 dienelactone hydrolase family protein [Prosthecobacter sp.]